MDKVEHVIKKELENCDFENWKWKEIIGKFEI
jgi:hypothetical protein